MTKQPLVTVCVLAYQHGNFIKKCLDSIVTQETNFPFEVIIGEDESIDGTREICKDYALKYPDIIRLFLRSRKDVIYVNGNATGKFNFFKNLQATRGKYVAICEGDDYWIDKFKLQKQVDFMEANPDYSIVFCNTDKLLNDRKIEENRFTGEFDFVDFMKKNSETLPVRTGSSLFIFDPDIIEFYVKCFKYTLIGDYPLFLLLLTAGRGYCLEDVMTIYRKHGGGISSNFRPGSRYLIRIQVLEILLQNGRVPEQYLSATTEFLKIMTKKYAKFLVKKGHIFKGARYYLSSIK